MLCAVLGVLMKNNGCSNRHQFFRGGEGAHLVLRPSTGLGGRLLGPHGSEPGGRGSAGSLWLIRSLESGSQVG